MSYKVSARAAEIFLRAFYASLFIQEASFAFAARAGRDALRSSRTRGARFQLEREVIDWFVPIFYTSREDSMIQWPNSESLTYLGPEASDQIPVLDAHRRPKVIGRDFDLLRLEMMLREKVIFLHGPSGAGKSALLKYARHLWIETNFLDVVLYIDFRDLVNVSIEGAFESLLLQHLLSYLKSSKAIEQAPKRQDLIPPWEQIDKILRELRVAIMFDNMEAEHSTCWAHTGKG
jgi:hypothetical protein